DSPNADAFDLTVYRKLTHSFESVYLTNEAQAGKTLRLLFGKGNWDVEQTTPTVDLVGLLQQENLAQITDPEKLADKSSLTITMLEILVLAVDVNFTFFQPAPEMWSVMSMSSRSSVYGPIGSSSYSSPLFI
ncbi:unnamed protein product, partial [marine sediment metagenome]